MVTQILREDGGNTSHTPITGGYNESCHKSVRPTTTTAQVREWTRTDPDLVPTANTTKIKLSKYKFKAISEERVGPEVYRTWAKAITHMVQPIATNVTIWLTPPFQWQGGRVIELYTQKRYHVRMRFL